MLWCNKILVELDLVQHQISFAGSSDVGLSVIQHVLIAMQPTRLSSLAHKSDFAGHVIVTTGLRRMHFPRPGIFLSWNSNLQQVDFSQGFASNNILGLVVLAVNDGFLHLHM